MTAAPAGQKKADAENTDPAVNATLGSPAESKPLPTTPGPNDPVEAGLVQVTRNAKEDEQSDPGGKVTEQRKTRAKVAPKNDPLKDITDHTKLPVSVTVGQVTVAVELYAGRPVASLSLVGWVGDAPLKVLAADIGEIEQALAELRKILA